MNSADFFQKKEESTREITIYQKLQEYVFFAFRSSNSKMIAYSWVFDVKNSLYRLFIRYFDQKSQISSTKWFQHKISDKFEVSWIFWSTIELMTKYMIIYTYDSLNYDDLNQKTKGVPPFIYISIFHMIRHFVIYNTDQFDLYYYF